MIIPTNEGTSPGAGGGGITVAVNLQTDDSGVVVHYRKYFSFEAFVYFTFFNYRISTTPIFNLMQLRKVFIIVALVSFFFF